MLWWAVLLSCAKPLPAHSVYSDAASALAPVLSSNPRVVAVGEVHSSVEGPEVPSTLSQFTDGLLPVLAAGATDLVFETWVVDGSCGGEDVETAKAVAVATARPASTESDIARAARKARELGLAAHALSMSCDEMDTIVDGEEVQYGTLLRLLTDKLAAYADLGLGLEEGRVLLYGGAVHNDMVPGEGADRYSYAAPRRGNGLVELDVYVPELLEAAGSTGEPWWPLVATVKDRYVLHRRADDSFVLLLPRHSTP